MDKKRLSLKLFSLDKIIRWLNRQQFSESVVLAVIAILIGLTSGIGVWLFKQLFNVIFQYAFEGIDTPLGLLHHKKIILQVINDLVHWIECDRMSSILGLVGNWMIYLVPVIGGLVVGLISHFFIGKERYQGIAGIMESVALGGGRLPYRKIPIKTVAAALSIGSGASVGPADPSVQIGAYLGSMFGQLLRLSDERIRALVASGVAGGIAAAFNAPITGIFFALEIIIGELNVNAFGLVAKQVFPSLHISPPAFAMVGMAAVLAGTIHAPITSFILLFEMTHDYRIILPLIAAVNVSLFLSWHLQHDSVYTLGLARKGIRLQRGRDVGVLETITVDKVMETEIDTLRESDSLTVAIDLLMRKRYHGLPVINDAGELIGIITVQDIDRIQSDGSGMMHTVGEVCTRELLLAYPDETIRAALRRIGVRNVSQLPVVARDNSRRLVGLLRNTDIARAYDLAVTRRAAIRHRAY